MSGDVAARRSGATTVVGTFEDDVNAIRRVYTNRAYQLQVGPSMGAITLTRDSNQRITALAVAYDRPTGNQTVTWTITKGADGLATDISEGVLS